MIAKFVHLTILYYTIVLQLGRTRQKEEEEADRKGKSKPKRTSRLDIAKYG